MISVYLLLDLCLRLAFLPTEETKMRQLRKRGWFMVDNQVFAF